MKSKKAYWISSILVMLMLCGAYSFSKMPFRYPVAKKLNQKPHLASPVALQPILSDDSLITLVAVGDMMLGTNFPSAYYLPPANSNLLQPMWQFLQNQDLVFGNLEGTILNSGGQLKKCQDSTKCYAFRQPEYLIDQLVAAKFNLLSIANNHMGDFGETGRTNSVRVLTEKGFRFAGLERKPYDTLTVKGVKVGLIAFAPNDGCLRIERLDEVKKWVEELKTKVELIIVSFHGGAEGSNHTHITRKTEIFYDEDRGNVHEFARVAIDAGADVILGHGPHVPRAVDLYKGRFITYSMGNFHTYARFNLKGACGIAPLYQIRLNKDGSLVDVKVISTKQLGEGGPLVDETNAAYELVKRLTQEDVPEAELVFDGKNRILPYKK